MTEAIWLWWIIPILVMIIAVLSILLKVARHNVKFYENVNKTTEALIEKRDSTIKKTIKHLEDTLASKNKQLAFNIKKAALYKKTILLIIQLVKDEAEVEEEQKLLEYKEEEVKCGQ